MREFIKRESKQTVTIREVPERVVKELDAIWERLGFEDAQIKERLEQAEAYMNDLFHRFISEEKNLEDEFVQSINEYEINIASLNLELGHPVYTYRGSHLLIVKEKVLKEEHQRLKYQKDQRMIELMNLKQEESDLCAKMGQTSAYVSSEKIPSSTDLNLIKENIARLKLLRDQRWSEFNQLKDQIKTNHKILHERVDDPFLKNMVLEEPDSFAALNSDNLDDMRDKNKRWTDERKRRQHKKEQLEEKVSAVARRLQKSNEFIGKLMRSELSNDWLQTLEENLNLLEEEKKTKLKGIILNMREELRNIWDKLYYGQNQRDEFIHFYTEDFSEDNCTRHEGEIEKLNKYYNQHKNMYGGVEKWRCKFEEFREMKEREKDPNRYKNNRGKSSLELQKELKRMNLLKRKLPSIEEELINDIEEWQNEHDQQFLVEGIPFIEHIENQWREFDQGKKLERFVRNQKKKEQLAVDMVYGTKTPTKRPLHGSNRDLTKRSRLEGSVMSSIAISKLSIPAFAGSRTPTRLKENAPSGVTDRKLRRRSKSATNLLNPLSTVKSTIRSRIENVFRTPQPTKKGSRIPKPSATDRIKRTGQRILRTVEEKDDDKLLNTLEEIDQFEYGPTSAKSAPNRFLDEEEPMSYEDFGASLKRGKNPRSSAIGVIQITSRGGYEL